MGRFWVNAPASQALRHGFTVADVERVTVSVVCQGHGTQGLDRDDRFEAAWGAVVELLYASESAPSRDELYNAARRGLGRLREQDLQARGFASRSYLSGAATAPQFLRFWQNIPAEPVAEQVTESVAVGQVLAMLTDRQREVLWALADHGDYQSAQAATGLSRSEFFKRLSEARCAFLAHWHQGETLPPRRGRDHRAGWSVANEPPVAQAALDTAKGRAMLRQVEAAFDGQQCVYARTLWERLAGRCPDFQGWGQRQVAALLRAYGVPTNKAMRIGGRSAPNRTAYRLADIRQALDEIDRTPATALAA